MLIRVGASEPGDRVIRPIGTIVSPSQRDVEDVAREFGLRYLSSSGGWEFPGQRQILYLDEAPEFKCKEDLGSALSRLDS